MFQTWSTATSWTISRTTRCHFVSTRLHQLTNHLPIPLWPSHPNCTPPPDGDLPTHPQTLNTTHLTRPTPPPPPPFSCLVLFCSFVLLLFIFNIWATRSGLIWQQTSRWLKIFTWILSTLLMSVLHKWFDITSSNESSRYWTSICLHCSTKAERAELRRLRVVCRMSERVKLGLWNNSCLCCLN